MADEDAVLLGRQFGKTEAGQEATLDKVLTPEQKEERRRAIDELCQARQHLASLRRIAPNLLDTPAVRHYLAEVEEELRLLKSYID